MIRNAVKEDAEKILAIYSYYVKNTAISFELDVPSLDEFQGRIVRTLERYPYLVLEEKGVILGYAYAGVFPFMLNDMQKDAVTAECFTRRLRLR